jgi:hypothetical protein
MIGAKSLNAVVNEDGVLRIFQGIRRETLARRATGWMAATAKGAAGFLGTKKGGR